MAHQNNISQYAQAIQEQLTSIMTGVQVKTSTGSTVTKNVPVYASFNRNWARETEFVTWQLRNVHQEVYTGKYQDIKGIDRPIFQISVFTNKSSDAFNLANTIIQSLHGYTGQFGGVGGFYISKADVVMLYHGYDDEINLYNIFMDCTLDIPA